MHWDVRERSQCRVASSGALRLYVILSCAWTIQLSSEVLACKSSRHWGLLKAPEALAGSSSDDTEVELFRILTLAIEAAALAEPGTPPVFASANMGW